MLVVKKGDEKGMFLMGWDEISKAYTSATKVGEKWTTSIDDERPWRCTLGQKLVAFTTEYLIWYMTWLVRNYVSNWQINALCENSWADREENCHGGLSKHY